MGFKYRLEILTILAILGFCALFLYTSSIMTEAEFAGADTQGSALVAEITGKSDEEFHPLIWQWSPPSGEIEAGPCRDLNDGGKIKYIPDGEVLKFN